MRTGFIRKNKTQRAVPGLCSEQRATPKALGKSCKFCAPLQHDGRVLVDVDDHAPLPNGACAARERALHTHTHVELRPHEGTQRGAQGWRRLDPLPGRDRCVDSLAVVSVQEWRTCGKITRSLV